jgi:hypothetical protein
MNNKTLLGVQVARLMIRGLVHEARVLAGMRNTWTPIEARAILGVGREMQRRGWIDDGIQLAHSVMGWK